MKLLFISDIHGRIKNLNFLEQLINKENFDKIVVLGDLYYTGLKFNDNDVNPILVKEFLTKYKDRIICIKGNCDLEIDVSTSNFPICTDLSLICIDNLNIYLTHGDIYNIESSHMFNENSILVHGHMHYPYIDKKDGVYFICVGSISVPRNNSKCSYMIYENKKFTIYDTEENVINCLDLKDQ